MDSLEILSLGRNGIKKIEGLNEVCDTLKQLWISYNQIASFSGIEKLVNLTTLYASNNKIDKWAEVERLAGLTNLRVSRRRVAAPRERVELWMAGRAPAASMRAQRDAPHARSRRRT